jgi:hypothetical protein
MSNGVTISYEVYNLSQQNQYELWFLFFCYLWTTEFICSMGSLVIAISVANWYFTKPGDRTTLNGFKYLSIGWHDAFR